MPEPLHPAVVHLPIALALLMPFVVGGALWLVTSGRVAPRAWWAVVGLQAVLVASGWAAMETGEHEEHRVEEVVAESHIEEHEEAAERFMWLAAAVLGIAAVGLLQGRPGAIARGLCLLGTLGVLGAAGATGHLGGELVYRHGAAAAYTQGEGQGARAPEAHDHD